MTPERVIKNPDLIRVAFAGTPPAGRKLSSLAAEAAFRLTVKEQQGTCAYQEWKGALSPHDVMCANKHLCSPRPSVLQRRQGLCSQCIRTPSDVFYVVRNPYTQIVKFGITSGNGSDRLNTHKRDGFTEIVYIHKNFSRARQLEDTMKILLRNCGFQPIRGHEYFRDNALPFIRSILPVQGVFL